MRARPLHHRQQIDRDDEQGSAHAQHPHHRPILVQAPLDRGHLRRAHPREGRQVHRRRIGGVQCHQTLATAARSSAREAGARRWRRASLARRSSTVMRLTCRPPGTVRAKAEGARRRPARAWQGRDTQVPPSYTSPSQSGSSTPERDRRQAARGVQFGVSCTGRRLARGLPSRGAYETHWSIVEVSERLCGGRGQDGPLLA